jgi:hypothetical protein
MAPWLLLSALVALGLLAAPADGVIDEPTTVPIDGTEYVVTYPSHWQLTDYPAEAKDVIAYLKQYPEAAELLGLDASTVTRRQVNALMKKDLKNLVFLTADIDRDGIGDGNNVTVKIYNEPTFTSLKEWKTVMRLTAEGTDSEVVSDQRRVMNGHQVFTHIERYPDGTVWATIEVNLGRSRALNLGISLDVGGEDLAQAIMDSVQPA